MALIENNHLHLRRKVKSAILPRFLFHLYAVDAGGMAVARDEFLKINLQLTPLTLVYFVTGETGWRCVVPFPIGSAPRAQHFVVDYGKGIAEVLSGPMPLAHRDLRDDDEGREFHRC